MASYIHILEVVKDGDDGLIVTFSDGTVGGCVVEELLELRPVREKAKKPKARTLGAKATNPLLRPYPSTRQRALAPEFRAVGAADASPALRLLLRNQSRPNGLTLSARK